MDFVYWKTAHSAIGDHERSSEHNLAISSFIQRSQIDTRIDAGFVRMFLQEKDYWRCVLRRIVSVVKFLSSRGLAYRGSNQKLGSCQNGNFLAALEL